ncbi:MAG: DUF2141 domain-containing protein [Bacteroidetes bacterium]|nr:MAG: DUF2141 domain-containing protein [Bacteroidota bacterium]
MTQILIILVLLLSISSNSYQLEVKVENIKSQQGIVKVCIFDNEKDFFGKALKCIEVRPGANNNVTVRFKDLPPGTYAVVAYHDINENGRLDRNFLGIPSEPYAFSNNPSTLFGPPSFSRAAFELKRSVTIRIKL